MTRAKSKPTISRAAILLWIAGAIIYAIAVGIGDLAGRIRI
jgi:hypothetical protein